VKVSSEEFRAFVARRGAQLHRTAYLLCGDWHLANDVVQDTLVKACQHWKRVQRAESPDAYVQRILVNEVNRTWRRRDKVVVLQGEVDRVPTAPDQTDSRSSGASFSGHWSPCPRDSASQWFFDTSRAGVSGRPPGYSSAAREP